MARTKKKETAESEGGLMELAESISVKRTEIDPIIGVMDRVIDRVSQLPQFSQIELSWEGNVIQITGQSAMTFFAGLIPHRGEAESITFRVPAAAFSRAIKSCTSQDITLMFKEKKLEIRSGKRYFQIPTVIDDNYPSWDEPKFNHRCLVSGQGLAAMLNRVKHARQKSKDAQSAKNHIRVTLREDGLEAAATDEYRMAIDRLGYLALDGRDADGELLLCGEGSASILLPEATLDATTAALVLDLEVSEGEDPDARDMRWDGGSVEIASSRCIIRTRIVDTKGFPAVEAVIPKLEAKDVRATILIDPAILAGIVKTAKNFLATATRGEGGFAFDSILVHWQGGETLRIMTCSEDGQEFYDEMPCQGEGEEFCTVYGVSMLTEAMDAVGGEQARIEIREAIGNNRAPTFFFPVTDKSSPADSFKEIATSRAIQSAHTAHIYKRLTGEDANPTEPIQQSEAVPEEKGQIEEDEEE